MSRNSICLNDCSFVSFILVCNEYFISDNSKFFSLISFIFKLKAFSSDSILVNSTADMDNETRVQDDVRVIENMTFASFLITCCLNVPVAIFGIFGNVFTLVMLVRKIIPGTDSLRFKLIHLTIADLTVVLIMAVVTVGNIYSYLNPVDGLPLQNIILTFTMRSLLNVPYSISAYLVMFIALERVLAIVKPFKVKTFCGYKLVKIKLCVCYTVFLTIGILQATKLKLIYNENKSRYVFQHTEVGRNKSLVEFLDMFVIIMYLTIPILVTLVCNIIFVASLLHRRHKMARMVTDVNPTANKKKSKTEGMILLLSVLFFVTVTPSAITRTYIRVTDGVISADIRMGMAVNLFLLNINHCLNPMVYTVTVVAYRRRLIRFVTFNRKGREVSSIT